MWETPSSKTQMGCTQPPGSPGWGFPPFLSFFFYLFATSIPSFPEGFAEPLYFRQWTHRGRADKVTLNFLVWNAQLLGASQIPRRQSCFFNWVVVFWVNRGWKTAILSYPKVTAWSWKCAAPVRKCFPCKLSSLARFMSSAYHWMGHKLELLS